MGKKKTSLDTFLSPSSPPTDEQLLAILEAFKQEYEVEHNPIDLILSFSMARRYGLPIPEWILATLTDFFRQYLDQDGRTTLDRVFGLVGRKGPDALPRNRIERKKRDLVLMAVLHSWKCHYHLSAEQAAHVVWVQFREIIPPNPKWIIPSAKILSKMYSGKWKRDLMEYSPIPNWAAQVSDDDFKIIVEKLEISADIKIVRKLRKHRPGVIAAHPIGR